MQKQTVDRQGITLGMWLFLYTEIMLFGGVFILYTAYRHEYGLEFMRAAQELSLGFGTGNTVILLISSFTVAAAITAVRQSAKGAALRLLGASVLLGALFLLNKYFEWHHKIELGIYPNSPKLAAGPPGENIFFGLYYLITGLHGLHVLVGLVLLSICAARLKAGLITQESHILLHNCGLYWHLVDLIWIFVFPLLYLVA